MTEDEAKTKWCPFSSVISGVARGNTLDLPGHQASFNRVAVSNEHGQQVIHIHPSSQCIGSECMAWRATTGTCGLTTKG